MSSTNQRCTCGHLREIHYGLPDHTEGCTKTGCSCSAFELQQVAKPKNLDPEKYRITVKSPVDGGTVLVNIDGEEQNLDAFEFVAPVGRGLRVQRVLRMELVPDDER